MREIIERLERLETATQYKTVNDAYERTGKSVYRKGRTEIWYRNKKGWKQFPHGAVLSKKKGDPLPTAKDPGSLGTHVLLGKISTTNKGEAWEAMQGDFWSPEGEARTLIRKKGLVHTSMSVGDIVKIGNKAWMVEGMGFELLPDSEAKGTEFVVVGLGAPAEFDSEKEMLAFLKSHGIKPSGTNTSSSQNKLLQGRPTFKDLAGPMKDGKRVRYETWETYKLMSI